MCNTCFKSKSRSRFFAVVAGVLLGLCGTAGTSFGQSFLTTIYVATNGDDNNSGLSVGAAVKTIGRGLAAANQSSKPVLVLVSPGEYSNEAFPISIPSEVTLRGSGNPSQVIINGAGKNARLARISGATDAAIEQLTLRNGIIPSANSATPHGAGVFIESSSNALLKNNIIEDCEALEGGGGVCIENSTATLEGCIIKDNTGILGGALYIFDGATATLTNNVMRSNYADSSGGGGLCGRIDGYFFKESYF